MNQRISILILGLILLIAGLRVGATWRVFSQTYDEGVHIAAGMEWLTHGTYEGEPQHPPLARVAAALGPFLSGARAPMGMPQPAQGNEVLHSGDYRTMLALARAGILPFFLLSIVAVWLYARWLAGEIAGLAAAALYANEPTVLAHAGLATTDMALTAGLVLALYLFHSWLIEPTAKKAVLLGITTALAIASKFTALLYLPVAGAACAVSVLLGLRRVPGAWRRRLLHILVVLSVTALGLWAVYRFSIDPLEGKHRMLVASLAADSPLLRTILTPLDTVPLPATPLLSGIAEMIMHNQTGHSGYLLGEHRTGGWWYYFPVAIAVKTTILFLVAAIVSAWLLIRRGRGTGEWHRLAPAAMALAILLASLASNVNIGVRHVLPLYPLLAIVVGCAAAPFWDRSSGHRAVLAGLLVVALVPSARAHPDYLPYFNLFAGDHPERILIDSNLDWGQDLLRLSERAEELNIRALRLSYFGTADLTRHHLPRLLPFSYQSDVPGWSAISISNRESPVPPAWLDDYEPVELIGKSILLYRITAPEMPPDLAEAKGSFIVPLQLGTTVGARTVWISELMIRNESDRLVQLQSAEGETFRAAPESSAMWKLTAPAPATLLYTSEEDESLISGSIRVESRVDGVPQNDDVTVPLVPRTWLTNDPIELAVPACEGCRRMLRVYDAARLPDAVTVTTVEPNIERSINLLRTADPTVVAAVAQVDLATLFPEIAPTERVRLTIEGDDPRLDGQRWAFVTLSGNDRHDVILPDQ